MEHLCTATELTVSHKIPFLQLGFGRKVFPRGAFLCLGFYIWQSGCYNRSHLVLSFHFVLLTDGRISLISHFRDMFLTSFSIHLRPWADKFTLICNSVTFMLVFEILRLAYFKFEQLFYYHIVSVPWLDVHKSTDYVSCCECSQK